MKQISLFIILAIGLIFAQCNYKTIKGDDKIVTEERNIGNAHAIKLSGDLNVTLIPSNKINLSITGDENILPFIITENDGDQLVIKYKKNISYSTSAEIKIVVKTPLIDEVILSGSGNISTEGKFTGGNSLKITVAGSGDAHIDVNTPIVKANIAGSGNIVLKGETKDADISIGGNGDFDGMDLKAENVKVAIAGTGNVKVFAADKLNVSIAGSGDIAYKGNPTITKKIMGSGSIKKSD